MAFVRRRMETKDKIPKKKKNENNDLYKDERVPESG